MLYTKYAAISEKGKLVIGTLSITCLSTIRYASIVSFPTITMYGSSLPVSFTNAFKSVHPYSDGIHW